MLKPMREALLRAYLEGTANGWLGGKVKGSPEDFHLSVRPQREPHVWLLVLAAKTGAIGRLKRLLAEQVEGMVKPIPRSSQILVMDAFLPAYLHAFLQPISRTIVPGIWPAI